MKKFELPCSRKVILKETRIGDVFAVEYWNDVVIKFKRTKAGMKRLTN